MALPGGSVSGLVTQVLGSGEGGCIHEKIPGGVHYLLDILMFGGSVGVGS